MSSAGSRGNRRLPRSPGGEDANAFVEMTDILLHCSRLAQIKNLLTSVKLSSSRNRETGGGTGPGVMFC